MQGSVGSKADFQKHFAFELQTASFVGVNGIGLESDLNRSRGWTAIHLCDFRSLMYDLFRAKPARGYPTAFTVAAAIAITAGCHAITKIGTGYRSLNSFCSARAVALTGTSRHF